MKTQNPLRNKLIALMYLVVLSWTVLYGPTDWIQAFTDLNRTLERSNYIIDGMTTSTVKTAKKWSDRDSSYYRGYEKLLYVQHVSDSTINYIEGIKQNLIAQTGGYDPVTNHLKGALVSNVPTRELAKGEYGDSLKAILTFTKIQMLEVLDVENATLLDTVLRVDDEMTIPSRSMAIPFIGGGDKNQKAPTEEWKHYYFMDIPLNGAVALLTKFQNDVRLAQTLTTNTIFGELEQAGGGYLASFYGQDTMSVDTILLEKGVRKYDVFNIGEDGVARIMLPGLNESPRTGGGPGGGEAILYQFDDEGNVVDSFQFQGGTGEVKLNTDKPGEFKMMGVIKYRYPDPAEAGAMSDAQNMPQPVKEEEIPFEINYKVVNPRPFLSQKDYNILYAGINNPLNVYHPEYQRDRYKVYISQGKILDNGKDFYARVNRTGWVTVWMEVPDENGTYKRVAQERFQVRELPEPIVLLHDKEGGDIAAKIFKQQKGLKTDLSQLAVDARFRVVEFTLTYVNGDGLGVFKEKVKGSYFTGAARELIELAQPGDIYIFEDIKVKGPTGKNHEVEALVFNII